MMVPVAVQGPGAGAMSGMSVMMVPVAVQVQTLGPGAGAMSRMSSWSVGWSWERTLDITSCIAG